VTPVMEGCGDSGGTCDRVIKVGDTLLIPVIASMMDEILVMPMMESQGVTTTLFVVPVR
jgi:hypothetical protein